MASVADPIIVPGEVQEAFVMPRDGSITNIYMRITNLTTVSTGPDDVFYLYSEIYQSALDQNSFYPVPGTKIKLSPAVTNQFYPGFVFSGKLTNLNIPVSAGEQLLMVVYLQGRNTKYAVGLSVNVNGGFVIC